jgi:thiamine-monophosphate kinase
MAEFELIRRHFASLAPGGSGVILGIGDDCALLDVPAGFELAVTTDTLVAGRHFPDTTAPADIGWKSLAVNLSDLAAMGARPHAFTLALTLPSADDTWLAGFASGLADLASAVRIPLVGGDTTRGPLSITITAMGLVPAGQGLRRSGARVGDIVCVTGTLGDAALALRMLQAAQPVRELQPRLDRPTPRLAAGVALREFAHAAIDLSDGLAGDLSHVLAASGVGATIEAARLPMSAAFARLAPEGDRLQVQVSGGDDYELCVCIPPDRVDAARRFVDVSLTPVGRIEAGSGLRFVDAAGATMAVPPPGFDHFR